MALNDQITELTQKLEERDRQNRLNPEGKRVLSALRSGSVAPAQLGLILQGASFSSSDEIIGSLRGALDPNMQLIAEQLSLGSGQNVSAGDVARAMERAPIDQYREENPVAAFGYEMAGATPFGFLGAGKTLAANAARAGASGALSGYMAGEGSGLSSDRITSSALGAGLGVGGDLVMSGLRRPLGNAYDAIFRTSEAQSASRGRREAERMLVDQIKADGLSVEEAISKVAQLAGKDFTIADLGPNTQSLMDAIAVMPGPGKATATRYLEARQQGRNGRLGTILQEAFGQRANYYNDFQALKSARGKSADRLYGSANKIEIPYSSELRDLMRTPAMQEAYARAAQIAANRGDGTALSLRLMPDGRLLDRQGNPVSAIQTRFLDIMKKGIDDVAFPRQVQPGLGTETVMAIRDLRTDFLDYVDKVNPTYARARALYAGDSAVMNAMERGRGLLKEDPDELADALTRMNASEKEAFRLGALQNLQDQFDISVESANMARNIMKSKRRMDLLRMAFPDGDKGQADFDIFMDNLSRESTMAVTERAAANSMTAQRSELLKQMRNRASTSLEIPSSLTDLLVKNARDSGSVAEDQFLQSMASRLADMLVERDPATLKRLAKDLESNDLMTVLRRHAPELLADALPFVSSMFTNPQTLGSEMGRIGAQLSPQQQALIQ